MLKFSNNTHLCILSRSILPKRCWKRRLVFNPFFNGFHSSTHVQIIGNKSAYLGSFFSQIRFGRVRRISLTKLSKRCKGPRLNFGYISMLKFSGWRNLFLHNVDLSYFQQFCRLLQIVSENLNVLRILHILWPTFHNRHQNLTQTLYWPLKNGHLCTKISFVPTDMSINVLGPYS